jgi:hypothetical protein
MIPALPSPGLLGGRLSSRHFGLLLGVVFNAFVVFGFSIAPAVADDEILTANPTGVATSPLGLSRCRIARGGGFWHGGTYDVVNRTPHQLLTASVTLRFYDSDNALIGQATSELPISTPVVSGDTGAYQSGFGVQMSEPASAVVRIDCRPASATFSGNKRWAFGQTWPEKLLPMPSATSAQPESADHNPAPVAVVAPKSQRLPFVIAKTWNDIVNGNQIVVHAALVIQGGTSDTTIHASDFTLTMRLASGAKKTFDGLARQAPTFQRLNPLGSQLANVNEVDPKSDLGGLGSLIVPANGTVNTTVSFYVPDVLADANDNRAVVLK